MYQIRQLCVIVAAMVGPIFSAWGGELPADYFKLMSAEVAQVAGATDPSGGPSIMLAAAVLYTQDHPANQQQGDEKLLALALQLGDLVASDSESDPSENRQDYEWEIHFWLDAIRLLEPHLEPERRARWIAAIEKNIRWFADQVQVRIDFPRYQGPFIRTSTNHYALFSSTVHLAGRVLHNEEWQELGAKAMHRLAAEEQAVDGYWGEYTDNGPATGYDYLTMACVALYWEHSHDAAALDALRRSTDFHKYFTWPDGTPVETINGRNRHWAVSAWGQFGFSHWPDGRRYAEFLAGFFSPGKVSARDLGRIAQSSLYYHEGPTAPIPQDLPRFAYQMHVPAGIRRAKPWTVCLSGLFDAPTTSQFTLDRQAAISVYHDAIGMIVSGANSKHQPELATFMENADNQVTTVPFSSRLKMSDAGDQLGLAHRHFFAVLDVSPPEKDQVLFKFEIVEQGSGQLQQVQLNLQLVLNAGELLETAQTQLTLSENPIELGPKEIGGWIRHRGWKMQVDPTARLRWPVYGFNPYQNAPEKELRHAVGVLSVPVKVAPPETGPLNWGRQQIAFSIEAKPTGNAKQ